MAKLSGFTFLLSTPRGDDIPFQSEIPRDSDFQVLGGLRTNTFSINNQTPIDITSKSSGQWREILPERGILLSNISGEGFLDNAPMKKELERNVISQKLRWFRIAREDGRSYYVKCKIINFNITGEFNQALTFSIQLESTNAVSIKDAGGFAFDAVQRKITSFSNMLSAFEYINSNKYASPSYQSSNVPYPSLTSRLKEFLDLVHGLKATLSYDNNIFSSTVVGIGANNMLLEYVRLTGTTSQSEPDRGRWRISFDLLRANNPFAKPIKALEIAIGNANPVTIPLSADNVQIQGQPAFAFKSTNALARDPVANTNDINLQYNLIFNDDTSAYEEINLLNADKGAGGSAAISLVGRNVANRVSYPFLFLRKSQVENKFVQFLDSLDQNVSENFVFLGEKTDNTNVVWYAYYLNFPLKSAENYDVKIQIGS